MDPDKIHKTMRAIRSTGSKIEIRLGKALWAEGIRYRKNDRSVYGTPDFTIKRLKIAIFADSEFWHGQEMDTNKLRIRNNSLFWSQKIARNRERDKEVNTYLQHNGWVVIRFWGKEIEKNLEECISVVKHKISERQ